MPRKGPFPPDIRGRLDFRIGGKNMIHDAFGKNYIHGFGPAEERRLREQAAVLAPVVFKDLPLPARGRLLELGCGVGAELDLLAQLGPGLDLTGIDLSPSHLGAAQRHLGDGVALVRGDAGRLPFGDGTFDRVLTVWLLEHVRHPEAVLREALRVLKPAGRLICTEVDNASFRFSHSAFSSRRPAATLTSANASPAWPVNWAAATSIGATCRWCPAASTHTAGPNCWPTPRTCWPRAHPDSSPRGLRILPCWRRCALTLPRPARIVRSSSNTTPSNSVVDGRHAEVSPDPFQLGLAEEGLVASGGGVDRKDAVVDLGEIYLTHLSFPVLSGRVGWCLAGVSTAGMLSSSLQGRIHGVPHQAPADPERPELFLR